ncbi:MAG: hypothetical protein KGH98_03450 [Candidatus Micrarchaeota archaeon]|nr:hypothetical protein [Candidatus Micrarchaeota archaeon]
MSVILSMFIALLTALVPGYLIALALLKKTELNHFEIIVIGFIFGLVFPAMLTWLESYLMGYVHAFTYSLGLFLANTLLLTIIGIVLCVWQGAFKGLSFTNIFSSGGRKNSLPTTALWLILVALMLITFLTRMQSIVVSPQYFEFDPYFDMLNTQSIITFGYQLLYSPSAWPAAHAGTVLRVEPIIPYLEAYWYSLATNLGAAGGATFNTTTMALVSSFYPPITAALLVFVVFMILYHEYNEHIAVIGAALAATMSVLFTTFIAGEQLLEPWGLFALFFFMGAYVLAIRNMKDTRLALLAGLAFSFNFLGAHYYTVTAGVLMIYILVQGIIDIIKKDPAIRDFYKMNAIALAVIVVLFALFNLYQSTLANRLPSIAGIPIIVSGPVLAFVMVLIMDYLLKFAEKNWLKQQLTVPMRLLGVIIIIGIIAALIFLTPLGKPLESYYNLSAKFTTPSSALFMTVQEYEPTGPLFDFGGAGFGFIGGSIAGIPVFMWAVIIAFLILVIGSIFYRNSKTGIFALAISLIALGGIIEVKYLPHFGVVYILMLCIVMGELIYLSRRGFKFTKLKGHDQDISVSDEEKRIRDAKEYAFMQGVFAVGVFFVLAILGILYALYLLFMNERTKQFRAYLAALLVLMVIAFVASALSGGTIFTGEAQTVLASINAYQLYSSNPTTACQTYFPVGTLGNAIYCNVVPSFWLQAGNWMSQNVGPYAPRILSWWDYGDWINWFGHSNAVLRGDNSIYKEDYATAAQFVLGPRLGFTPQTLASYMNANQTKYVIFDRDLILGGPVGKWGALDFLACININATSESFAQAQANGTGNPYITGTSQCEFKHSPEFMMLPITTLSAGAQPSVSDYCSISNSKTQYISGVTAVGTSVLVPASNATFCINATPTTDNALKVYDSNGTRINAYLQSMMPVGVFQYVPQANFFAPVGPPYTTQDFVGYMMFYYPTGSNQTVQNNATDFYNSNFYRGFILGKLPGFTQVFPLNETGQINFINATYPIRIFALDNYTGGLPPVPQKPSWVQNNYTMP